MATITEQAPKKSTRRLWLILAGILLLFAATGFGWWWVVLKPRYDEMRPFVGTWKLESPYSPTRPELVVELDILSNGTLRDRVWDSQKGILYYEAMRPQRWCLSGGRFQEVMDGHTLQEMFNNGNSRIEREYTVIWEGPDRFRLEPIRGSTKTTIWSRCEPHR